LSVRLCGATPKGDNSATLFIVHPFGEAHIFIRESSSYEGTPMNEMQRLDSMSPSVSAEPEGGQKFSQDILTGLVVVGLVIFSFSQAFVSWAENLERRHHRAQLLAAYRRRHAWKRSDIPHLKSLGVNSTARSRMERLAGRGRPVVRPHQPLDVAIITKVSAFRSLVDPDASPDKRRRAFKLWPWWPHYVEAMYRAEHAIAKERGTRAASTEAEILVGRALGISSATVHSICGEIRRMRKDDQGSADFPAMTVAEYENWMETGKGRWTD
jgi:hypothetical protein